MSVPYFRSIDMCGHETTGLLGCDFRYRHRRLELQKRPKIKAPALPRGAVRGCSVRGGSDFSHRRQILGQDTYLMGDCERSERLEPAAGGNFFENDAFKEKIY